MKTKLLNPETVTTKGIFFISLPIFGELLLQLLVGNVDQIMLSQYSQNSVAAIGNGNQIMNIVILVLSVMSSGVLVLLTQYIGACNKKMISEVCTVATAIMTGFGILATIGIVIFCRPIFIAMHVPSEILDEACQYMRIVGSCIFIQGIYLIFAAILRSFSLVKEVLIASCIMNLINIIGNDILLNGLLGFPEMGIMGVAISTNISKCAGVAMLIFIFIRKTDARIRISMLRPFPTYTLKRLLYISIPFGAEGLSYQVSQILILSMVNTFGTVAITTRVYSNMIANLSYVYVTAFSQAMQIVMGYWIGAGKIEKIEANIWKYLRIGISVCLTMTLVFFLNSDFIYGLFSEDPRVWELGRTILIIEFFLETGRAMNLIMVKTLITTGDIYSPVIVGVVSQWLIGAGLSFLFAMILGWGLAGTWIAMALDEVTRGLIFIGRFRSGKWKQRQLI